MGIGLKAQLKAGHVWQVQTQKKGAAFLQQGSYDTLSQNILLEYPPFNLYSTIIISQVDFFGAFDSD